MVVKTYYNRKNIFVAVNFRHVMPSVPYEKVRVVYPPCDVDSLSVNCGKAISRLSRPKNDRYVFLSMNRFWPEKRLDIILDAAGSFLSNYKFKMFLN